MPTISLASHPLDAETLASLQDSVLQMKSDKFWRDMANALDKGLRHCRDEAEAFDSISAKAYRKQAIEAFEVAEKNLDEAAQNKLFQAEARLTKTALMQLRGNCSAEEIAAAKELDAKEVANKFVAPKMPGEAASAPTGAFDDAAAAKAKEKPFTWEQDDEGIVVVSISAPPNTAKGDLTVAFGEKHLKVTMKGHPLQPAVIDSDLLYGIKPNECSWALEGKGAKRAVVLTLEKSQTELVWAAMLDDEKGRKTKGATEVVQELHGLDISDMAMAAPLTKFSSD